MGAREKRRVVVARIVEDWMLRAQRGRGYDVAGGSGVEKRLGVPH